ncbi:SPL family radical SAM protein [Spirochaeta cellobiosiphila]|uniref:SPL family radical SAM protein n=1 Tax=Spirochaeta cellobiosiphila TaxID=504483 RepID=UPI000416CB0C|nr:radical SAM protein [Spirochaeta cellobiosiphila]
MHFKEYKGILSSTNGMNLSRGCTHGCIYCDSRSEVYGMDHDFEDVEIKINAPELLEQKLRSKRSKCMIGTGAMSDPYIPIKENLSNLRSCLEIIDKYEYGISLTTKSSLVLRDLDILTSINKKSKCVVQMTLTTYDEDLCRIIEPRVSTTKKRFETLKVLKENGIETVVWLCPILPYINDTRENIEGILNYCIEAGVKGILCFEMGVTLREGNRAYFYEQLDAHFPGLKSRYQRRYGNSYGLPSDHNRELMDIFHRTCEKHSIMHDNDEIFRYLNEYPYRKDEGQLKLF